MTPNMPQNMKVPFMPPMNFPAFNPNLTNNNDGGEKKLPFNPTMNTPNPINNPPPMNNQPAINPSLNQQPINPSINPPMNMPGMNPNMNPNMRPPNYKTKPCRNFHSEIGCNREIKCHFIHDQKYAGKVYF